MNQKFHTPQEQNYTDGTQKKQQKTKQNKKTKQENTCTTEE